LNIESELTPCFNPSDENAELSDVFLEELFTLGIVVRTGPLRSHNVKIDQFSVGIKARSIVI
jgi:hypothetical protein